MGYLTSLTTRRSCATYDTIADIMENILWWAAVLAAVFIVFKFILRPLFKVIGLVAVGVAAWWFLGDDIAPIYENVSSYVRTMIGN